MLVPDILRQFFFSKLVFRSPHQIKAWFRKQRAAQRPRHLIVIETEEMDKVMMRPKIVRENFVWSDGMFADVVEAIGIFGADS